MPFPRMREKREVELVGLIDVVFLLLIFFLVIIGQSAVPIVGRSLDLTLPEIKGWPLDPDEPLETLTFRFGYRDEKQRKGPPDRVWLLLPYKGPQERSQGDLDMVDRLTYLESLEQSERDSLFADIDPYATFHVRRRETWKKDQACELVSCGIRAYKDRFFRQPDLANHIEISAVKETPFRWINFILTECSSYQDTIPNVAFRTIHSE